MIIIKPWHSTLEYYPLVSIWLQFSTSHSYDYILYLKTSTDYLYKGMKCLADETLITSSPLQVSGSQFVILSQILSILFGNNDRWLIMSCVNCGKTVRVARHGDIQPKRKERTLSHTIRQLMEVLHFLYWKPDNFLCAFRINTQDIQLK